MLKQLMNKEIISTKTLYIKSNIVKSHYKKKKIIVIKLKTNLRLFCNKELSVRESKVQTKYSNLFYYKERLLKQNYCICGMEQNWNKN